jgi:hypothetical protein|tara:strand:+ start:1554 stop:1730 length:177 start_codon:yes stop_codon:yes gene_type:complete
VDNAHAHAPSRRLKNPELKIGTIGTGIDAILVELMAADKFAQVIASEELRAATGTRLV